MRLNQTNSSSKSSSSASAKQNLHHHLGLASASSSSISKPNVGSSSSSRNRDREGTSSILKPSSSSSSSSSSKPKHISSTLTSTSSSSVLNPQNIGVVPRNPLQPHLATASSSLLSAHVHDAHVMSEQSRKVLEEIQKTKSNLLKQGSLSSSSSAPGITSSSSLSASASSSPSLLSLPNPNFPSTSVIIGNPPTSGSSGGASAGDIGNIGLSPIHRAAFQTLQLANASSFGSYVSTDSHFGNAILPVLPRLINNNIVLNSNNNNSKISDKV